MHCKTHVSGDWIFQVMNYLRQKSNMNVNIGDKVKIEATIVDYNEGAKIVKNKEK